ncbi:hypothetical protein D6774_01160 [Candidatus Woesearchaeota archaeon]|nr:MAG: hypothetical protein D6774_01160 [Candidatus Woesearchaeota archaeon]
MQAVKRIVQYCSIQQNETILIVYDASTRFLAQPLEEAIKQTNTVLSIDLDNYKRPLTHLPQQLKEQVLKHDVVLALIEKKKDAHTNETAFRSELLKTCEEHGGRFGSLWGITPHILESAYRVDPQELKAFTQKVFERAQQFKKVQITDDQGTNLHIEFDKNYSWIISDGFIKRRKTRNVMPSEIYTYPSKVNGVLVITGTYSFLLNIPGVTVDALKETPLTWVIKESRIVDVDCKNTRIEEEVKKLLLQVENADRIGEFGIGTNYGIKELLGNVMHDEKFPGIHIAHGHGYPNLTKAPYTCDVHFDAVLIKPTVVDEETGEVLLEQGCFKNSFEVIR